MNLAVNLWYHAMNSWKLLCNPSEKPLKWVKILGQKKVNTHPKIPEIDLDFFRLFFELAPPPPLFSISDVSERFKESISWFPANFKKFNKSQIFDLSRDQTSHRAQISRFLNMLELPRYELGLFIQYWCQKWPRRFFDDWPSRSRLNVKFQNQKLAKNGEFDFALVPTLL